MGSGLPEYTARGSMAIQMMKTNLPIHFFPNLLGFEVFGPLRIHRIVRGQCKREINEQDGLHNRMRAGLYIRRK